MNSYDRILQQISKETFSSNKMNLAKQYISDRWMTTSQISEIIKLFTFANDKLELAKFSYKYVMDPKSYFAINDVLQFSNDKDELSKFILENKRH